MVLARPYDKKAQTIGTRLTLSRKASPAESGACFTIFQWHDKRSGQPGDFPRFLTKCSRKTSNSYQMVSFHSSIISVLRGFRWFFHKDLPMAGKTLTWPLDAESLQIQGPTRHSMPLLHEKVAPENPLLRRVSCPFSDRNLGSNFRGAIPCSIKGFPLKIDKSQLKSHCRIPTEIHEGPSFLWRMARANEISGELMA
jgi:hypothetical protein